MKVRELINGKLIKLNLKIDTKEDVLREITDILDNENRLNSRETYYDKLIERERQFSTGVGYGIAIPHAKTDAVKIPTMTVIRLANPIEWKSIDEKKVNLIIGLAVPEKQGDNTHLKIISSLSMKLMEDSFRNGLIQAESGEEILDLMDIVFPK